VLSLVATMKFLLESFACFKLIASPVTVPMPPVPRGFVLCFVGKVAGGIHDVLHTPQFVKLQRFIEPHRIFEQVLDIPVRDRVSLSQLPYKRWLSAWTWTCQVSCNAMFQASKMCGFSADVPLTHPFAVS